MMERRYEAYKDVVVRPFYREHFARLDRQIVLVDALAAFNAGPDAVKDLESALAAILGSFRTGRSTIASALFRPRIDRILFAATKADHLHHANHDRLERFLSRITERAIERAKFSGAHRRCGGARRGARDARGDGGARARQACPPSSARRSPARRSAASASMAKPKSRRSPATCRTIRPRCFARLHRPDRADETDYRFLRFRPPLLEPGPGDVAALPHIRLDRALQFLLGDRLA